MKNKQKFEKLRDGYVVFHADEESKGVFSPIGICNSEDFNKYSITGYIYVHYNRNGALSEKRNLEESWDKNNKFIVKKVRVRIL